MLAVDDCRREIRAPMRSQRARERNRLAGRAREPEFAN
jgi:hypothetical protein